MIIVECEQNTPEWFDARMGKPTASGFDKIITASGKASEQMEKYANHLIGEVLLENPVKDFDGNYDTNRGKELEDEAFNAYEFQSGMVCTKVGFVTNDSGTIGCSPDLLVGDDGLGELKCPKLHVFMEYLLSPEKLVKAYKVQVQGQLYVTKRKWVDLIAYYPGLPLIVQRVYPEQDYLTLMSGYIAKFLDKLAEKRAKLIEMGYLSVKENNHEIGKEMMAG